MKNSDTLLGGAIIVLAGVGTLYFLNDVNRDRDAIPWVLGAGIVPLIIGITLIKLGRKK